MDFRGVWTMVTIPHSAGYETGGLVGAQLPVEVHYENDEEDDVFATSASQPGCQDPFRGDAERIQEASMRFTRRITNQDTGSQHSRLV